MVWAVFSIVFHSVFHPVLVKHFLKRKTEKKKATPMAGRD
jgi:hypothetical protein